MPITDLLVRNAKEYRDEIALVEINPEAEDSNRRTWKEFALIEANPHDIGRKEMTWGEFDIKANKYISTQLYFQLYYNKAQNHKVQTQTVLGVGLAYTFKNK